MSAEREKRSVGWIGGAVAFWALSAWLVVVGLSSIIPQIFWPADALTGNGSALTGCREELRDLQRALLDHAADALKNASDSSAAARFDGWLAEYDAQLKNTSAHCAEGERASFDELVRARHGVSDFMGRFAREEAPRLQQLDAELGREARAFAP